MRVAPRFAHQAGQVGLDGAEADVQAVGDLMVRPALSDRGENLLFTAGERFKGWLRRLSLVCAGEGSEQPRGDAGVDERVAMGGGTDGLCQQVGARRP